MEKAYEAAYSYKRMVRISDYGDMIEELPAGTPNLPKRIPDILRVPKKKEPVEYNDNGGHWIGQPDPAARKPPLKTKT